MYHNIGASISIMYHEKTYHNTFIKYFPLIITVLSTFSKEQKTFLQLLCAVTMQEITCLHISRRKRLHSADRNIRMQHTVCGSNLYFVVNKRTYSYSYTVRSEGYKALNLMSALSAWGVFHWFPL